MIFSFGKKKKSQRSAQESTEIESELNVGLEQGETQSDQGKKTGLFSKLTSGLARSSARLTSGLKVFNKRKLDATTVEELEDLLVSSDLGVTVAKQITGELAKKRLDKEIDEHEVRRLLAEQISLILKEREQQLDLSKGQNPRIVFFVGVNGSGKTTTIGKIASQLKSKGRKILLVAGDTFRAAAIEQLTVWGERTGVAVATKPQGSDASGLVYDAMIRANTENFDIVLVDTAGRLQNRTELMSELAKLLRVARKIDPEAPHEVLLVLDATVGQNALRQVEAFRDSAEVTGLIMTKLDGTAKGGILVAIAQKYDLPIHFIGIGEGRDDLKQFESVQFAHALTDNETEQ